MIDFAANAPDSKDALETVKTLIPIIRETESANVRKVHKAVRSALLELDRMIDGES